MLSSPAMRTASLTLCPHCQRDLTFIASWDFCGLWGYHGPIFVSPQIADAPRTDKGPDKGPDHGDRDSLVSAPRKPTPGLNVDAIAMPEPDSD